MTQTVLQLSHPRQLNASLHGEILRKLRNSLEVLKATPAALEAELTSFRVRDWWLILQEGRGCLEIYLDKGYFPASSEKGVQPGEFADGAITLDQCQVVHEHLLATDALSEFDDEISVQVGSPGIDPPLRDLADFVSSIGLAIDLKTWQPVGGREKFVMVLLDVQNRETSPVLILQEGPHTFEIAQDNVKFALALPDHPLSPGKLAKAKVKRGAPAGAKKSKQKR